MSVNGNPRRALLVICLACVAWAVSFGLGSQVISHWLSHRGYSDTAIGINHTAYYLGLTLAAIFVPALMRRWGRACPVTGMILCAASLALFPYGDGLIGYFVMRLISGAGSAVG